MKKIFALLAAVLLLSSIGIVEAQQTTTQQTTTTTTTTDKDRIPQRLILIRTSARSPVAFKRATVPTNTA